ncbi:MAG: RluA family pseudouridine synthase [Bacillota bacterium]|nr:RluA family pseudouridine synthase [Bacillota bacterium]
MKRSFCYTIGEGDDGKTIEAFLLEHEYTPTCIKFLKKAEDLIRVNGKWEFVTKELREKDILETVFLDEESSENIPSVEMPLDIIYEDADILVVNKAAKLPIHPTKGYERASLANGVVDYYEKQGETFVFRSINRIDKNTTGLVIIAKNMLSGSILGEAMRKREIRRTYLAVTEGELPERGTIDLPIGRREGSAVERKIDENGAKAVTHFERLYSANGYSLAKIRLETGRTHQIRLHMRAIGHPLPADELYHPVFDVIERHALHSWKLEFPHPITKELLSFTQELPADMKQILGLQGDCF